MTTRKPAGRACRSLLLAVVLAGSPVLAAAPDDLSAAEVNSEVRSGTSVAQPQDEEQKDKTKKGAAEDAAPPEAASPEKEEKSSDDGDKASTDGKEEPGDTDEAPELKDFKPAAAVAGALRQKGEVVSQSGDLNISVNNNMFTEFPGFDLSKLTSEQRDLLIKRSNSVYCTCGCRGDTVARCVVLNPSCQVARKMLQKMLDEVTSGEADKPETKTE